MAFPFLKAFRRSANDNTPRRTKRAVPAGVGTASEVPTALEPPRPLVRDLGEPAPYPVDALGTVLGEAARAIADVVQAPTAMAANSVLAAATLVVQPHANVVLPYGQARPIGNLFATVAQSGDRKTGVDGLATDAIRRHQEVLAAQYEAECRAYRAEKKRAAEHGLDDPAPPLLPMFLADDPNPEGIFRLLREGQPSLGLFSDEGGRFIGGYAMGEDQRLKTATTLSGLWDGTPLTRVRGGEPASILLGRRFSAHLMVQPGIAALLLADPLLKEQGLLSRLLVTAPRSIMGTRMYRDPPAESREAAERYTTGLLSLLALPLPVAAGSRNQLEPRRLLIDDAAKVAWIAFADNIERQLGRNGRLLPISGVAAKLAEHAARIAAVLTLVQDIDALAVGAEAMEGAISIARHHGREALRLLSSPQVDADLALAAELGAWLLQHWEGQRVSLVDVYQRGPKAIRSQRAAAQAMRLLEEHFWIVRLPGAHEVNGAKRREVWYVVPQSGS